VTHFGRGRGDYSESEHPLFWQSAVAAFVEARRDEVRAVWEEGTAPGDPGALTERMEALVTECTAALLEQFYPDVDPLIVRAGH
jgi:hypothetical protein